MSSWGAAPSYGTFCPVPEVAEDVAQGDVHGVGADDALLGEGQVDRDDDAGAVLPAAESAVAADQALEGGDLLGAGSRRLLT